MILEGRKMEVVVIAAMSINRVIGNKGKIPWHISDDFKRFKEVTSGHPVLMGRKTFESLPIKPLPNRENIVITSNKDYSFQGVVVRHSLEDALDYCKGKEKVFIIGGASIYKQALDMDIVDVLDITLIDRDFEGDTFFPEIDFNLWKIKERTKMEDPIYGRYWFLKYERE